MSAAAALVPAPASFPGTAEWLSTDGAGGYACGSVDDLPRRRYHGCWVVRPAGSARRRMVVAGFDERLLDGVLLERGPVTRLQHAHWRDLPGPTPPSAAVTFAARPLPTWTFVAGERQLERTVALRRTGAGQPPCLLLRWRNPGAVAVRAQVRPLLGWCDADHLPPADERFDGTVQVRGASWGLRPNELLPTLWLTADGVAAFRGEPAWYRGFVYATDRDRGYDHIGDRWCPGVLELELGPGCDAVVAFTLGEPLTAPAQAYAAVAAAAERDAAAVRAAAEPWGERLAQRAEDFLYRADGDRLGVLAGFPWFGEWGRDVFIALPGLTIARGQLDRCAEVLRGALPFLRDGLLPNIYGRTAADSHYGSCDAALWFALAVQRFADAGGDPALVRQTLVPALAGIADAYRRGTELGLLVLPDGLLRAGSETLNATWMDAQTAQGPVTPRAGLPVEIQALWHALLAFLAEHDAARWRGEAERCGDAFRRGFWLGDGTKSGGQLADRVHHGTADRSVRPNMLVAAALPRAPWSVAQRAAVVAVAARELVTPRGLRTLSPRDPAYRGRYEGHTEQRDAAYHQGTAWPWLAGFYVEAALAATAKPARPARQAELRTWLRGFAAELDVAGIDHLSEVFDGDEPQRPGGTFAQAWNTGELLRALRLCAEAGQ